MSVWRDCDDGVIITICKQRNIFLPEGLREEEECKDEIKEGPLEKVDIHIDDFVPEPPTPKKGFWGALTAIFLQAQVWSIFG